MEKNIFKGAKFGDKFVTRDGKIAILTIPKTYQLMLEDTTEYSVMSDGLAYDDMATSYDIVSKYQEPIDEDKLDELVHNHCMNSGYSGIDDNDYINDETLTWGDIMKDIKRAYKSGYRKAKEE